MLHNPLYNKTDLKNGLRIVTEEIPHVRSVALGVWITVGSRDENLANNGAAHFIEHMLFKGTKKRTTLEIAESLEAVGGSLDAFTTKELTCYGAHILDEHLPLAADVISDILSNSVFDPVELEKEKEVILNEMYHYKDTPDEMVFEHFYKNIFPNHPLGYPIYGTENNIKTFTRKQILNFFHNEYAQDRIVVTAAGNIDHENVVQLFQNSLESLPEKRSRRLEKGDSAENKLSVIEETCSQAHVCFGTPGYAYTDSRKFPLMILNTFLGGGMSSLLFQKIREELGLVYSIYSFYDFSIDNGLFGVYFSTESKNLEIILDLIQRELKGTRNGSLDAENLEKIKNQLKGNLMLGLESTVARMNRLAKNEIYYQRHFTLDDIIKKIDSVTIEDIHYVANELFGDEKYFTAIIKPVESHLKQQ